MHSSIVLLAICSLVLVVLMITCFVCFIRSRRKEDEEFMSQYTAASARQQQSQRDFDNLQANYTQAGAPSQQQQQSIQIQQQQQQQVTSAPGSSPSQNLQMIQNELLEREQNAKLSPYEQRVAEQQQRNQAAAANQSEQQVAASNGRAVAAANQYAAAAAAAYAAAAASSPYHSQPSSAVPRGQETRSDITQQINSAIIGSSEAEFQNDFIQVFPMYQIAPQPEKNTTPYLT